MKKLIHNMRTYGLSLASVFLLIGTFQNCSEINFENQAGELSRVLMGNAELVKASFDPDRSENRPKINVTAIVDNSHSMAPYQVKTGNALKDVADKLIGFSGLARVYTTTWTGGAKPTKGTENFYLTYGDNNDQFDNGTNREGAITSLLPAVGEAPFVYKEVNQLGIAASYTENREPLPFSSAMDGAAFNQFKDKFNTGVNVGLGGSTSEQGLCTLLKASDIDAEPGSFQSFVLVTNEDDESNFANCYRAKVQEKKIWRELEPVGITTPCDPGSENCTFQYKVGFNDILIPQIKRLHKVRTTKHKISYKQVGGVVNYKIKGSIQFGRTYIKFKKRQYRELLTYKKYVYEDGAEIGQADGTPLTIKDYANGTCQEDGRAVTACTPADEAQLAAQVPKYVPNTCLYKCEGRKTGFENTGYRPFAKAADFNCDAEERKGHVDDIGTVATNKSLPSYQIVDVERVCQWDNSLINKQVTLDKESCDDSLTDEEKEDLYDEKFASHSGQEYIKGKQNSLPEFDWEDLAYTPICSVSNDIPKGPFDLAVNLNGATCEGLGPADSSSGKGVLVRTCDEEDLDEFGLTAANITECKIHCVQSQSGLIDSGWKLEGTTQYGEWTAANNCSETFGDNPNIHSCSFETSNATYSKDDCHSTRMNDRTLLDLKGAGTLTSGDILGHPSFASCSVGDFSVNVASLAMLPDSNVEAGTVFNEKRRSEVISPLALKKYVNNNTTFAEEIHQHLSETYGSNFHVTAFINRPEHDIVSRGGDGSCPPPLIEAGPARFEAGHRYAALHEVMQNNMDVYSNCREDYSDHALEKVFDTIVRKVGQSYRINMNPDEDVLYKVHFEMETGEMVEVSESLYEVDNAIITFKSQRVLDGVARVHTEIIKPLGELVDAQGN